MKSVTVIAELGSNPAAYSWDFNEFCWAAHKAGANAVKCQLWKTEHFPASEWAAKRPLEFPRALLPEFVAQAYRWALKAGASVFDAEAVELAAAQFDFLKLAAREQDNVELTVAVMHATSRYYKQPFYRSISTGKIVNDAGFHIGQWEPLYAIQEYPTAMGVALIKLIVAHRMFVREGFPDNWGWSSHTTGALDCVLAARLGASVIEKHLCLSKADPEGGHSLLPDEFGRMVSQIRRVTKNASR